MKWKIATASYQGRGHLKYNVPCQDKTFKLFFPKKDFYSVALADGAGSYKYSDIGAEFITKKVLYYLNSKFKYLFKYKKPELTLLSFIEKELIKLSKEKNIDVKEFSSTLLFIAIQDNRYILGHIGDGVIGYLSKNNKIEVLSYPENGEYANSTFFTTSFENKRRLKIKKGNLDNIQGFILMSDGVEESLYNKQLKKLIPVTKTIIKWLDNFSEKQVEEILKNNLKQVFTQKTIDDCSIGIIKKSFL